MSFLTTSDGTKIFYGHLNQSSEKRPLVFVHGFALNWSCFEKEINHFKKKGYPIIYLDLRGHGKSDKPKSANAYTFDRFEKDIEELLKQLSIKKKITLIGYSLGGMISLQYTAQNPKKVEKLVILNSSDSAPEQNKLLKLARENKTMRMIYSFLAAKYSEKQKGNKKNYQQIDIHENPTLFFTTQLFGNDPEIILHIIDMIFTQKPKSKNISCPTLIISSSEDELFNTQQEYQLAKKIPQHLLKIFPGKHDIIMKKPELISQEIEQFMHTNQSYFKQN